MPVTIAQCEAGDKQVLHHLYQFYLHDLSEYTDDLNIKADGAFDTTHIDLFWKRDGLHPFLIWQDGQICGFALVAGRPFAPEGADWSLVEFFVLRRYRCQGVGRAAARAVFDQFRGVWDLYELEQNQKAIRFWMGIIHEYTGGNFTVLDEGHRQRFDNR